VMRMVCITSVHVVSVEEEVKGEHKGQRNAVQRKHDHRKRS